MLKGFEEFAALIKRISSMFSAEPQTHCANTLPISRLYAHRTQKIVV